MRIDNCTRTRLSETDLSGPPMSSRAAAESGWEMRLRSRMMGLTINMLMRMRVQIRVRVRVRVRVQNLGSRNHRGRQCWRRRRRTEEKGDLGTNEIDFVRKIKP